MKKHSSKFRLSSPVFERPDENRNKNPKRMIFLSVEGDETERTYFQYLDEQLDNALIHIEVLRHKRGDGYSDPEYVIELLDEYISLREGEVIPEKEFQLITDKYSKEDIMKYLAEDPGLTEKEKRSFREDLMKVGIDLEYRRYLEEYKGETDYFAVVLDRDSGNHSRELMEDCSRTCAEKNYGFYVTNPCFEFWLLLHLCDVKAEFSNEELEQMKKNPKVSRQHTFVSRELSKRAHHAKTISPGKFKETYFPNIGQAIQNVQEFATDFPELFDQLGSNLPKLFEELKEEYVNGKG